MKTKDQTKHYITIERAWPKYKELAMIFGKESMHDVIIVFTLTVSG